MIIDDELKNIIDNINNKYFYKSIKRSSRRLSKIKKIKKKLKN